MLSIQKGIRLLGSLTSRSIFAANRPHARLNLLSASSRFFPRVQTPPLTLNNDNKLAASFSTRTHGLRNVMLTDCEMRDISDFDEPTGISRAQLAFDESNPFNDMEAFNCMVFIQVPNKPFRIPIVPTEAAAIVQQELNRVVGATGKATEWPVMVTHFQMARFVDPLDTAAVQTAILNLWRSRNQAAPFADPLITNTSFAILFKLPQSENQPAFFQSLMDAGLVRGCYFQYAEEGSIGYDTWQRFMDDWWYRMLYDMPEEQKYW